MKPKWTVIAMLLLFCSANINAASASVERFSFATTITKPQYSKIGTSLYIKMPTTAKGNYFKLTLLTKKGKTYSSAIKLQPNTVAAIDLAKSGVKEPITSITWVTYSSKGKKLKTQSSLLSKLTTFKATPIPTPKASGSSTPKASGSATPKASTSPTSKASGSATPKTSGSATPKASGSATGTSNQSNGSGAATANPSKSPTPTATPSPPPPTRGPTVAPVPTTIITPAPSQSGVSTPSALPTYTPPPVIPTASPAPSLPVVIIVSAPPTVKPSPSPTKITSTPTALCRDGFITTNKVPTTGCSGHGGIDRRL